MKNFFRGKTSVRPSRERHDAVAAKGLASILDLQIGPCSIRERSDIKGIERGVGLILLE